MTNYWMAIDNKNRLGEKGIAMKANREIIKTLIELSTDVEEADKVINENYDFKSIREKVAFLRGMFGVEVIGHEKDEPDEMTYFAMLSTVINK